MAMVIPGCVMPALLVCTFATPASGDVTDRFSRQIPIDSDTRITVDITIGAVQVTTWDRQEVAVEIVRRAPSAAQLALFPVKVEQGADGLLIRASQPDSGRDAALRADVALKVPADARLQDVSVFEGRIELTGLRGACSAHIERGDIVASGVAGTIRLETAIGNIRLEGATLTPDGMMRLRTFNGDVALELAVRPTDARILALSMGGAITSEIPLTKRERAGPRFGEATLGKGEPVISIDVVNGNVAITVRK
jgi:hypothetical protein